MFISNLLYYTTVYNYIFNEQMDEGKFTARAPFIDKWNNKFLLRLRQGFASLYLTKTLYYLLLSDITPSTFPVLLCISIKWSNVCTLSLYKAKNMFKVDENRIECFVAQYCSALLHPFQAQQYCSILFTNMNNEGSQFCVLTLKKLVTFCRAINFNVSFINILHTQCTVLYLQSCGKYYLILVCCRVFPLISKNVISNHNSTLFTLIEHSIHCHKSPEQNKERWQLGQHD